jgi:hypothetical protein
MTLFSLPLINQSTRELNMSPEQVKELVLAFIKEKHSLVSKEVLLNGGNSQGFLFQIAGNNFQAFGAQLLQNNNYDEVFKYCSHRYIDVNSMYLEDFGYVPPLSQISKKLFGQYESDTVKIIGAAIEHKLSAKTSNAYAKAPTYRPFLIIDVKTTGLLDCNPYLLEICLRFEDFGYFGDKETKELRLQINNGILDPERCQAKAMEMNQGLLKNLKKDC